MESGFTSHNILSFLQQKESREVDQILEIARKALGIEAVRDKG
jgi:hypothetical protein